MAGKPERPPDRAALTRAMVVNAASKPVNVVVPAGVAIAGALLGTVWLWPVAVVVYLALFLSTFFDADEAERVGKRAYGHRPAAPALPNPEQLAPPIAERLEYALAEERAIRETIKGSDAELGDVSREVDALVASLGQSAQRAQLVYEYLASQDLGGMQQRLSELRREAAASPDAAATAAALEEQLKLGENLEKTLERFFAKLDHAVVSLQTIRGQLVRISVADEDSRQADAADRVRGLREELGAVADGLTEAYARADTGA